MANAMYPKAKQSLLSQSPSLDFDSDAIKWAIVDLGIYAYNAAHQYVSDLGAAIVARSGALTGVSVTNGVFNAAAITLAAAASGHASCGLVLYDDTPATDATKPLIAYFDTGTGLPFATNGGDITITPDAGANKILALT